MPNAIQVRKGYDLYHAPNDGNVNSQNHQGDDLSHIFKIKISLKMHL